MKIGRFVLYIFIYIGIGALGCWIPLFRYLVEQDTPFFFEFTGNLGTFLISVVGLACADCLIGEERGKTFRLFVFLMTFLVTVACGTAVVYSSEKLRHQILVKATLGVGSVIALVCWIAVNIRNPVFYETNPTSALGGDIV